MGIQLQHRDLEDGRFPGLACFHPDSAPLLLVNTRAFPASLEAQPSSMAFRPSFAPSLKGAPQPNWCGLNPSTGARTGLPLKY